MHQSSTESFDEVAALTDSVPRVSMQNFVFSQANGQSLESVKSDHKQQLVKDHLNLRSKSSDLAVVMLVENESNHDGDDITGDIRCSA